MFLENGTKNPQHTEQMLIYITFGWIICQVFSHVNKHFPCFFAGFTLRNYGFFIVFPKGDRFIPELYLVRKMILLYNDP